uniref:hypothetical protein n=1 Tax=Shewanella sp. TaxID=50422 RepID=UPI0040484D16
MQKYFLILFFLVQFANAENLKLECNLFVDRRYSEGGGDQQRTAATVDVTMSESFKSIKIANHKIIAILNSIKTEHTISFLDKSNSGKWELMLHEFNAQKNERFRTSIRIDRNTGKIFFDDRFTDSTGYTNTSGSGDCVKVDVDKRKF